MSASFDAYGQWLDIAAGQRPPNNYQLLGLAVFESDTARIDAAFEARYALVRRYQVGEHSDVAVRLLQELSKAHDCLRDATARQQYDEELLREFPELAAHLEPEDDAADVEPEPATSVESHQIWVIMPAQGRRWGPLIKSQLDQAVEQGKVRADYFLQQDDWPEPRPATEFYRNLPSPSLLVPIAAPQTGPHVPQTKPIPAYPVKPIVPARETPWHVIIPCIAIGAALLILLPILLVIGSNGDGEQHAENESAPPAKSTTPSKVGGTIPDSLTPSPVPNGSVGGGQSQDDTQSTNPAAALGRVDLRNWGEQINPQGDCGFVFDDAGLTIVTPGPSHGLSVELGHMEAPRVLREVQGDFTITVKVDGVFDPGKSQWANRVGFQGAGLVLMKDDQTYLRLDRAAFLRGTASHYVSWELRVDGKPQRMGTTADMKLAASGPTYLRLVRRDNTISAYARTATGAWRTLVPLTTQLPQTLKLGIHATNSSDKPFRATFSELEFVLDGDDSARVASKPLNTSDAEAAMDVPRFTWRMDDRFQEDCYRVAISPDGTLLAASLRSGPVHLIQVADGRIVHTLTMGGNGMAQSTAFSNDGSLLAASSSNGTIDVWRTSDGGQVSRITSPESQTVFDLAFSPDRRTLVCRQGFKLVSVFDVASGRQQFAIDPVVGNSFRSVSLSPDGTNVAVLVNSVLYVMRLANQEVVWQKQMIETAYSQDVVYSPDGQLLALRGRENFVVMRAADGEFLQTIESKNPTGQAAGGLAQFSRDGQLLLIAAGTHAELWHWPSAERIGSFQATTKYQVRAVALAPDGDVVATSAPGDTMRLWHGTPRTSGRTAPTGASSTGNATNISAALDDDAAPNPGYVLPAAENAINLISLIDPARDTVKGDWLIEGGELTCKTRSFVPKMEIPYIPPEEYDFRVVFSQPKLRNGIGLIMPNNGVSFIWATGRADGGHSFSMEGVRSNPTAIQVADLMQVNQIQTTVVQVRKDSVTAFVDGRQLAQYEGDFSILKAGNWHKIRDTRLLALACDDPTTFHKIEVVEVTGSGTRTR